MCKESVDFLWMNRNYRNSREYSFLKGNCRNAQKFSWQSPTPALSPARGGELDYRYHSHTMGRDGELFPCELPWDKCKQGERCALPLMVMDVW